MPPPQLLFARDDSKIESQNSSQCIPGAAHIAQKINGTEEIDEGAIDAAHEDVHAATAVSPGNEAAKKKRKPKKKAKHLPLLPSVLAAADRLAWKLEVTTRLGRHGVAKQGIASGQLVLREYPLATAVRSQFVSSTCHICLKEIPTGHSAVQVAPALLRGAQQYKLYCSPACASADTHAALTAPVHGRIDGISATAQAARFHLSHQSAEAQVEPELLHFLLELDSRQETSPPPVHVRPDGKRWILDVSDASASKPKSKHAARNGYQHDSSHSSGHAASSEMHAHSAARKSDKAACPDVKQSPTQGRTQQQQAGTASAAAAASRQEPSSASSSGLKNTREDKHSQHHHAATTPYGQAEETAEPAQSRSEADAKQKGTCISADVDATSPGAASDAETSSPAESSKSKSDEQRKVADQSASENADLPRTMDASGATKAAGPSKGESHEKQKGAGQSAGVNAELPTLQCTLEDMCLLMAHNDNNRPDWRDNVSRAIEGMQRAIRDCKAFEPAPISQYLGFAALVNNNAHGSGAANSSNTDRGMGMFPAVSMLNHSCRPNCFFAGHEGALEVRAVRSIRKGEELTVTYINMTEPRKIRATQLMQSKFFLCNCERCTEPLLDKTPDMMLEAVKCKQGKCGGYLLEQREDNFSDGAHWTCTECLRSAPSFPPNGTSSLRCTSSTTPVLYPGALTERFSTAWNEAINITRTKSHAAARPALEKLLSQAQEALHPMHSVIVDCLMPLVNCCRATDDTAEAIKHLQQLLAALEVILGCHTVELGNLYGLLGELYLQRVSSLPAALQTRYKKQAKEACSHAVKIYTTCLGESHELCQEQKTCMRTLR